jgi:uncharacterized membrane protein YfcA
VTKKFFFLTLFALLIGFTNGLFGAGGGLILILFIENFFGLKEKKAHATCTFIILLLCIVGSYLMIKNNNKIDFNTVMFICLGEIIGGFIGSKLLNTINNSWLKKIFAAVIIISAVKIIL